MLISTAQLLQHARQNHYAVGAFNVYTLEGVQAVVSTAEQAHSPAILQLLPSALQLGGTALIACCLEAAHQEVVPMSVHLDHCSSEAAITEALTAGTSSIMADGSHLPFERNVDFSQRMAVLATSMQKTVEAELGRLSGTEDGTTVAEREACLTDPDQAAAFVDHTGVHALAVCIGNVHGRYHSPPELDFDRLAAIADRVSIPLVLHGTSGLPDTMITRAVSMGVSKLNPPRDNPRGIFTGRIKKRFPVRSLTPPQAARNALAIAVQCQHRVARCRHRRWRHVYAGIEKT